MNTDEHRWFLGALVSLRSLSFWAKRRVSPVAQGQAWWLVGLRVHPRFLGAIGAICGFTILNATGWPLTPQNVAHPLGNDWGEFQNYGSSYFHNGIDVFPDAIGQGVYAVARGWVKAWGTTEADYHYRLAISDSAMTRTARTTGWLYAHIDATRWHKNVGDAVAEGELIGYLVPWPVTGFDHTHFARISDTGATWSRFPTPTWWFIQNPLTIITPVDDTTKPTFENAWSSNRFAFCRNNTSYYFRPDTLKGDVDIIARIYDRINPYTSSSIWNRLVPQTLTYSIRGKYKSQPETLALTFKYIEPPIGASEINVVYKDDNTCNSYGDYDTRTYYFIVTNTDGDSVIEMADTSGKWRTTDYPDTSYLVTVTAIDAKDSSRSDSMWVTTRNNIRNVGCTKLLAPAETLDFGTVVTPACSVYNFGTTFAVYNVRMKIGASYDSAVSVPRHVPGQYQYVTFPAWTASPVGGPYTVSCSTELASDIVQSNDKQTGSVSVRSPVAHDVGCTRIAAPAGNLDSGAVVTPACSVYNFGAFTETYTARMKIGSSYNSTVTISSHAASTRLYVTFPTWTALPVGTLPVSCSTELALDAVGTNDKQQGSVIVQRPPTHDVGCTRLMAPIGTIDSGASVSPACSVFNFGSSTESYTVRCKIGSAYNFTASVTGHLPQAAAYVTFPSWTALPVGTLPVSCSTELAVDAQRANDKQTGSVIVRRPPAHDVGCTRITAPSGITDSGQTIAPACSVANYGTASETYTVRMHIGTAYNSAVIVSSHSPGARLAVVFPGWMALQRGSYAVKCSTELAGDGAPANDAQTGSVDVRVTDLGATAILAPAETLDSSVAIVPSASISNFSSVSISGTAYFVITNGPTIAYSDNQAVSLTPGQVTTVTFTTWAKPHLPGTYSTRCSTYVAGDQNHANDALTGSVTITGAGPTNPIWTRKADVPAGPKSKRVKDGGCLVAAKGAVDADLVYAFKGGNTFEFYAYNVETNTWAAKESIPAVGRSGKKKGVKKGGALCFDKWAGKIYATKGNNTQDFWTYDVATGAWTQKTDVPLGGGKAVKEGAGLVYSPSSDRSDASGTSYVFLLKGSNTTEFYAYDVGAEVWTSEASAPAGASGKNFKDGSCLVDAAGFVYALKAGYNEVFAYDVDLNTWVTKTPLPLIGRSGKKKKVKSGGSMAESGRTIYALKGGNTTEFWSYQCDSDRWAQLADMPLESGKRVKGGGSIVESDGSLYATKGDNTFEFYRYGPLSACNSQLTAYRPNVLSNSPLVTRHSSLSVAPNPFTGATTIAYSLTEAGLVSLKLYDITGGLVTTLVEGYHGAGASSFILNPLSLSSGIYLLKLSSYGESRTEKLIVE